MDIPQKAAQDIGAIATALIEALNQQITTRAITDGNVAIDAVINCLCYSMKIAEPRLEDAELTRRVARYYAAMTLIDAPSNLEGKRGAFS